MSVADGLVIIGVHSAKFPNEKVNVCGFGFFGAFLDQKCQLDHSEIALKVSLENDLALLNPYYE